MSGRNLSVRGFARHPIALLVAAAVLAGAAAPLPPLVDAATAAPPGDAELVRPLLYTLLAPVSDTLDALTFLSLARAEWLLGTWALVLAVVGLARAGTGASWRRRLVFALAGPAALVALAAAAVLLPRPVPRLVTDDARLAVLDYHAHTSASHDGPAWQTPDRLARWHARQGFSGAYVTDHNAVFAPLPGAVTAIPLLPGVEWSLFRLHLVAIGPVREIDRRAFGGDLVRLLAVFGELHRQGALGIASLPEYWKNHRESLDRFVAAGVDGFELVNCAPKAIGFDPAARADVQRLARRHSLLLVGASDNHGWGQVTCVWNLTLPGARGTTANRVLARPLALAQGASAAWTAALSQPWLMLRGLSWPERMSWLTWIALITIYRAVPARSGQPRGLGILARSIFGAGRENRVE